MALKLPRAIRLDPSDTFIFEKAAEPGEWVISGAFLFEGGVEQLSPKARAAFRGGFLGIGSFGWSTLAVVTQATDEEHAAAIGQLAARFLTLGAPNPQAAETAAREELAFAASLCDHPAQTLIAVHRSLEDGEIRERFRSLTPRGDRPSHAPLAFQVFQTDDGAEEPAEDVRLTDFMKPAHKA